MRKKAIIIGAGPVGLNTAYQLLTKTGVIPIILEGSDDIGGSPTASWLIRLFFTPKITPASCVQMAHQIEEKGGKIYLHQLVYSTYSVQREICSIHTIDSHTGELTLFTGDYFFSTLPVSELNPLSFSVTTTYENLFLIRHKKNYHHILKTLS